MELEPAPIWGASIVVSGLTHCALTLPSNQAFLMQDVIAVPNAGSWYPFFY